MGVVAILQVRMSYDLLRAIDQAAAARGMSRSEFARNVLQMTLDGQVFVRHPDSPGTVPAEGTAAERRPPSVDETVELLAERARDGVVGAQVALLRHLTTHDNAPAPDDPLAIVNRIAAERGSGRDRRD